MLQAFVTNERPFLRSVDKFIIANVETDMPHIPVIVQEKEYVTLFRVLREPQRRAHAKDGVGYCKSLLAVEVEDEPTTVETCGCGAAKLVGRIEKFFRLFDDCFTDSHFAW